MKDRNAIFEDQFRADLKYWIEIDRRLALRIMRLVDAIINDPFEGIGKPEPLKHQSANVWSRRIDEEHRLVYLVTDVNVYFSFARYHYQK